MNITNQISEAINEVSNRKSEELLACLAQRIAKAVKYQNRRSTIVIKMPGRQGSEYCRGSTYNVWKREILPQFSDDTELEKCANELGFKLSYNFEEDYPNAHYSLYFDFSPDEKPLTKVQILAHRVNKHYKKLEQKRIAIAEKKLRIGYLRNAANRKVERQHSYEVYKECTAKLLSKNFRVDPWGRIIIYLKSDKAFDNLRINKFLKRIGLICVDQQFDIVLLRQISE